MAPSPVLPAVVLVTIGWALAMAADGVVAANAPSPTGWLRAHATFYGGADASGTMGGACGYGNLYSQGYGSRTAALSTVLFQDGASCGQCYKIACDRKTAPTLCKSGVTVTVTATNFCPPNSALPDGGWCNQQRPHASSPSSTRGQVPCVRRGGVRFMINGHNYFNLVLVTNVGGAGSIKSMAVKSSDSTDWMPMARNWGANWHSMSYLSGKRLSFRITITDDQTLVFNNVVPAGWTFGLTFTSNLQFK
ncbi:Expansin-A13 [Zea mays]|uniref:Expansin n=1 Tax=Zea mays TaxID=4577 RepID=A0A1D6H579_MAIZE|nr:Expansin-A13 [Zea mays]